MNKCHKAFIMAGTALTAGYLSINIASGQTSQPSADKSDELQEIVVTAQRYSSNLQTTPVTISAFSGAMLDEQQIYSIADINKSIPGVVIAPSAGSSNVARIVMRGVGQENGGALYDPAVGIYIDNVYQPRVITNFFSFFDVDDVEVLRGPQGTLYGRNSSGGAIKIQTKTPSSDLTYSGDIAVGNYNAVNVRGYVSGGLIDGKLAASVSGLSTQRDGYVKGPNVTYGGLDTQAGRAKLLFTPTDDLSVELAESLSRDRTPIAVGSSITTLPGVVDPYASLSRSLLTTEITGPANQKTDTNNTTINAHYAITDELKINAVTGYGLMHNQEENPIQYTNAANAISGVSYWTQDVFMSQELNATYNSDLMSLVGGFYYFYEDGHQQDGLPYNTTPDFLDRITNAFASYGQGTYKLPFDVSLTGGMRYTQETSDFTQFYPTILRNTQGASKTFYGLTPKLGIDWAATPDLFFYATFTKGFKSGGFNKQNPIGVPGQITGPTNYNAEKVTNYEAGVKYTTPDHRLRVNGDIFEADYTGLQLPVFFPGTVITYTANAASAKVQGIELEPTWKITSDLTLRGNVSLLSGRYTSPFQCSIYNGTFAPCAGKQLKALSPIESDVGVTYKIPVSLPGTYRISGDWQHTQKYYNNVSNTLPLVATPTYDLVNADISYESPDTHWTVSFEVKNLGNELFAQESLQTANAVSPGIVAYVNVPRTYLLRIKAQY
jgi:iron complex outermembrane receptor protein